MEKSELQLIKFTGKNYNSWAFQFQMYLKGKKMWGYVSGTIPKPNPTEEVKFEDWETKDAQIMTWNLGSVNPHFIMHLRPHRTAKAMSDYLQSIYKQENPARRFQLEHEIADYSSQGNLSIQEFYSGFMSLWTEYTDIVYADISSDTLSATQTIHQTGQRDQFLMKPRPEFENVRSNLVSRIPSPPLATCLNELLCEEQRQLNQVALKQSSPGGPLQVAYATTDKFPQTDGSREVDYAARGRTPGRDMTRVQCYSYQKYGHYATQCKQKFCSYCKRAGYILTECWCKPQAKPVPPAYHAMTDVAPIDTSSVASFSSMLSQQTAPTDAPPITLELIQQMIFNAFSTLGISGKQKSLSDMVS